MTGLRKKGFILFQFIELNIVFLSKCFYSSFDENFYIFWTFSFRFRYIGSVPYWNNYYRGLGNIFDSNFSQHFRLEIVANFSEKSGTEWIQDQWTHSNGMQDMRNARQMGCMKWGMHDRKECRAIGMHNRRGAGHEERLTGGMQDMRNAWQEGCRTWEMHKRRMQEMRNAWQEGCWTWGMHDRKDAGHEECTKGGMQERWDAGLEGCRTGGKHERRDKERRNARKEEFRTGGMQE